MLKLIGINDIYKFEKQKGHGDGFFKIRGLAVIYDCTLERNFEESKKQQIENFCLQLFNKNNIDIGKVSISIKDCQKEVWIITKGKTRIITRIITTMDEVTVKEVSIYTLFELYSLRFKEISSEKELEEKLIGLGR